MKPTLTDPQKIDLEKRHKAERDGRVRDRIKAVLLANEGWTQQQIAQALRINKNTVWEHLRDYVVEQKLTSNSGGSSSKLDNAQTQELIAHLEAKTYPSTKEIIAYVQIKYEVKYSQQGMYDWLVKHNFSHKKPKGTPAKHDEQRQQDFIKKYQELKSSLKPDEIILFIDSAHPTSATKITYGWIRTGVDKLIATTAGHGRINLTGAINLNTMSVTTKEYQIINGASTVDFLKLIEKANPFASKIHIILDGGKAHTANEVKLFLSDSNAVNRLYLQENYGILLPSNNTKLSKKIIRKLCEIRLKEPILFKNSSILNDSAISVKELLSAMRDHPPHQKIVMHPLPPYSPNLNPIERLWKIMNERVRNNVVFEKYDEFKTKIHEFFNVTWDTVSSEFYDRINDNFQTLKSLI
jgi:transposase